MLCAFLFVYEWMRSDWECMGSWVGATIKIGEKCEIVFCAFL